MPYRYLTIINILLLAVNLTAWSRPYGKRVACVSTSSGAGAEFFETTSSLAHYFYASDYTNIADSILIETVKTLEDTTIVTHEAVYLNLLTVTDSLTIREYLQYPDSTALPSARYLIASDAAGRLHSYASYGYADSQFVLEVSWTFSYNDLNRPAVVYVQTAALNYRYEYAYDNLNRLSTWTEYRFINNAWTPQNRKLLNYSDIAEPFPAPLHFLDLRLSAVTYGRENLINSYDILYPVLSVTSQRYSNGSWVNSSGSSYNSYLNVYEIVLYYSYLSGLSAGETCNYFGYDGYQTGYESMYGLGQISSGHYTWEDYTPAVDDFQSPLPPVLQISAYPNPFITALTIINEDKSVLDDISIYNIKGQLIRSWKDVKATELTWDGRDSHNRPVSSGVYLIRAKQGDQVQTLRSIKL